MARRTVVRVKPATAPHDEPGKPVDRQRELYAMLEQDAQHDRPTYVVIDQRAAGEQTHGMLAEMVSELGLRVRANPKRTSFKIDRKRR